MQVLANRHEDDSLVMVATLAEQVPSSQYPHRLKSLHSDEELNLHLTTDMHGEEEPQACLVMLIGSSQRVNELEFR